MRVVISEERCQIFVSGENFYRVCGKTSKGSGCCRSYDGEMTRGRVDVD